MVASTAQDIRYVMLKPVRGQWIATATLKDHTTASASGDTIAQALKELGKVLIVLSPQE